nr:MAG TPA: Two component regulator propeller [Caudoviricetes sp.]
MVGNLSHKTECVVCVDNAGRMWYTRAHVPIYTENALRCS